MNQNIIPFSFESHAVRVVTRDGEPWFVAADVCEALNMGNVTMALRRLDDDETQVIDMSTLNNIEGRVNPLINVVSESGLYSLVLRSRKPEAKKFKKWITAEVIPSIRKTGRYEAGQPSPAEQLDAQCAQQLAAMLAQHSSRFLVWFEGGQFQGLRPLRPTECVIDDAKFAQWWRECGSLTHPDLALVPVKELRVLEAAMRTALVGADINLADLNALLAAGNLRPKPRPETEAG